MRQLKIIEQATNRESPSMDKYLNEIGKIKLISAEEEVSLAYPFGVVHIVLPGLVG
jgi:RNA polymerase primary sigma factor